MLTSLERKCKTIKESNQWTNPSKENVDSKCMALLSSNASNEGKLQGLLQHVLKASYENALKKTLTTFLL